MASRKLKLMKFHVVFFGQTPLWFIFQLNIFRFSLLFCRFVLQYYNLK